MTRRAGQDEVGDCMRGKKSPTTIRDITATDSPPVPNIYLEFLNVED